LLDVWDHVSIGGDIRKPPAYTAAATLGKANFQSRCGPKSGAIAVTVIVDLTPQLTFGFLIHRRPAQTPLPSPAEAHFIHAHQCDLNDRPNKTYADLDATALSALTEFIRTPRRVDRMTATPERRVLR